jgi:hypothetical protein
MLSNRIIIAVGAVTAAVACIYVALRVGALETHFVLWMVTTPYRFIFLPLIFLLTIIGGFLRAKDKRRKSSLAQFVSHK